MKLVGVILSICCAFTGCNAFSGVVGGTWVMDANYFQFPGNGVQIQEEWLFSFQGDQEVALTVGGSTLVGTFTEGPSPSIIRINDWFSFEGTDDPSVQNVIFISTSLVLEVDQLSGDFFAQYGESLQDALEALNGVRSTSATGSLAGHRVFKSQGEEGLGEALKQLQDSSQAPEVQTGQ